MIVLTSGQMREVDRRMIEDIGVSASALMEVAGVAVVREIESYQRIDRIGIVVGKGHNGADGFVAARYLLCQGSDVQVFAVDDKTACSPLTIAAWQAYERLGGKVSDDANALGQMSLLIDAILGTGARFLLSPKYRMWTKAMRQVGCPMISIDVPTGVDATTGEADDDAIDADVTVAMGFAKVGHLQYPGRAHTGRLKVASLSMPPWLAYQAGAYVTCLTQSSVRSWLPERPATSHKGTFAQVGIWAGSRTMQGALRFAVEGAYRVGAGLVQSIVDDGCEQIALALCPEAIVKRLDVPYDTPEGILHLKAALSSSSVALCGPGIGQRLIDFAHEHPSLLNDFAKMPVTLVADADLLNTIASMPERGEPFFQNREQITVITPHPKEFSRLTGMTVADIQRDRVAIARNFAMKHGVIVVLKGASTVIASPDGKVMINPTGNTGLAKGGTGDVLAGMIAGMIAQLPEKKLAEVTHAVAVAVYLHGYAAELATRSAHSEQSLLATDLLQFIGKAFHAIIEGTMQR